MSSSIHFFAKVLFLLRLGKYTRACRFFRECAIARHGSHGIQPSTATLHSGLKHKAMIGLRVNYGVQTFYRDVGVEPCCGLCRRFQVAPAYLDTGIRFCVKQGKFVKDDQVCFSPERAPKADDEG